MPETELYNSCYNPKTSQCSALILDSAYSSNLVSENTLISHKVNGSKGRLKPS